jgi:copper chaperone CopZ
MRLFTLKIQGMKSVLCVSSVERAVLSIEGVDAVHIDLTTGIAKIRCYDETVTEDIIKNKIIEVGYSIDAQKNYAAGCRRAGTYFL